MRPAYLVTSQVALRGYNSFGVDAQAQVRVEVNDPDALPYLFSQTMLRDVPVLPMGGGSNVLLAGDPPGAVLCMGGDAIAIVGETGDGVRVRADAGVVWHALVQWSLDQGLSGLENLALIPGHVGAAPIQNIGAYGVEVCTHIHQVQAFDRGRRSLELLPADACAFAYRDSRFKHEPDRWIVTAVEFNLHRHAPLRLGYAGLAEELARAQVIAPTPRQVANAVCRIRQRKLPDPALIGNAGSFFHNPVVPAAQAQALQAAHPGLPAFALADGAHCKLPAAWLIEACGWKGHRDGDAGVSADHALVLVNHGQATGAQVLALARRIAASVQARFGVALTPEPRIVGDRW